MISFPYDSEYLGNDEQGNPMYDRAVGTDVLSKVFGSLFTNGIIRTGDDVASGIVSAGSGMVCNITPARYLIDGHIGIESDTRSVQFQEVSYMPRIDTIVARHNGNKAVRSIDYYVVQGVPSNTPVAPTLTRSTSVYELGIANVYHPANATSVSNERITSTLLDSARCGLCLPIEQVDTTGLYLQIQEDLLSFKTTQEEDFIEWFDAIKGQLTTDQAVNLQLQINNIDDDILLLEQENIDLKNKLAQVSNPNLLINGDFRNPVNQRGSTSYVGLSKGRYSIDRWVMTTAGVNMTVNANSITLTNNQSYTVVAMRQYFEHTLSQNNYTVSVNVLAISGESRIIVSSTTVGNNLVVGFNDVTVNTTVTGVGIRLEANSSITLEWIKLEQGSNATMQVPNKYSQELSDSQRYYKKTMVTFSVINGKTTYVQLIPEMRIAPTLTINNMRSGLVGGHIDNVNVFGVTAQTPTKQYTTWTQNGIDGIVWATCELITDAEIY